MTALTHQLAALVLALWVWTVVQPEVHWGLIVAATVLVMIGALTPDLDQPAANLWERMLGARALGHIFQVFSGGHRHMTHSILGIAGIGLGLHWIILHWLHPSFINEGLFLWRAYMIGYVSHPIMDTLTDRGVPWFWPLRIHVRIPPGPEEVRVTTGSFVETVLVRGALLVTAVLLLMRQ